jgi:predicted ABC-type ATPase
MSTARELRRPSLGPDAAGVRADTAERERVRSEPAASGLERRLASLPDGHPSAAAYASDRSGLARPEQRDRVRPLTDAEYAEHVAEVEAKLEQARAAGLATDLQHTIDPGREFWSDNRELSHDSIIESLYLRAVTVPREGRAILAGGMAGAGKTTVLSGHMGIDLGRYLIINPDAIKGELARRGMIPLVNGISPMEASDLVHEESSYIARRLAARARAESKNLIWDITMSRGRSTESRISELRGAGYSRVEGVFVDVAVEVSLRRAEARHRKGHEDYRAGIGMGGRYVAPALIIDQAEAAWGSQNRRNFELVKGKLDAWSRYDNSVDGRQPRLAAAWTPDNDNPERR